MKEERFFLNQKRNIVDPESPDAVMLVIQVYDDEGELVEEEVLMREDFLESLKETKPKE